MPQYSQIVLRSAAPGGAAVSDFAALRENTLRLLRNGWRIPVLARHAPAGSIDGGPQLAPVRAVDHPAADSFPSPASAVGHLIDLVELPDGSLGQVIEVAEEFAGAAFSSPEIRPRWTDGEGRHYGPIIAHIALTERPQSAWQTPLTLVQNNESPHFPVPREGADDMNPTIEKPTDVGVVETDDPRPELPETDALPEAFPDEDTVLAEEEAISDEQLNAQRVQLAQRIRASRKLPKGLRDRMADLVETRQFSDDEDDVPRLAVAEAVEMIEAAIPENLQFHEGPLETPPHPRGEGFFSGSRLSDTDAQRIASEQLAATGFGAQG